eukprot:Nitzschia sp. Nitz4//scaffold25_size161228//144463//149493//NITZ4_002455-RA/size161228-augustus-gene-0.119-mRNA-1//1//CDS//3329544661//6887//frame0
MTTETSDIESPTLETPIEDGVEVSIPDGNEPASSNMKTTETSGIESPGLETPTEDVEASTPDEKASVTSKDDDTKSIASNAASRLLKKGYDASELPTRYRLMSEKKAMDRSMNAILFTVVAAAISTRLLTPNFPIMVTQGAHPDSFPDTEPFDFNSATYFLPMCSLLGVAAASAFVGKISDKIGRKKVLVALAVVSAVGGIVKYFCRARFWPYCTAEFFFGFFLGNLPVALAYLGDVATSKHDKEAKLGVLVGGYVIGLSGGGMISILLNDVGLFTPQLVSAGITGLSAILVAVFMIEPGKNVDHGPEFEIPDDADDDAVVRPKEIDVKALVHIIVGAVADNFGSTALVPLCLSPLAFKHYYLHFIEEGEDPIMELTGFQWLSVMVAFVVVPSAVATPAVFRVMGVAGTCVFGNLMTGVVTLVLLLIGNAAATRGWFFVFAFACYVGFPFTVFSQLTTGPMLDAIAPVEKLGYVQGLNNAAMNFGQAVAPWLFGLLADAVGTNITIIVGIGVSCLAATINFPLTFDSRFGKETTVAPLSKTILKDEDPEFLEQALAGEVVDQERLLLINFNRMNKGKPPIIPHVKPYSEEKEGLLELCHHARPLFEARTRVIDRVLMAFNDSSHEPSAEEICEVINKTAFQDAHVIDEASQNLGKWIGEYLADAGYAPHLHSTSIKQMILTALPPISFDKELNPENLENAMVRTRQVLGHFVDTSSSKTAAVISQNAVRVRKQHSYSTSSGPQTFEGKADTPSNIMTETSDIETLENVAPIVDVEKVSVTPKEVSDGNMESQLMHAGTDATDSPVEDHSVSEKKVMDRSMGVLLYAVLASAISTRLLTPNYPIMVTQGAHPDSFPDTEPFDFNSATYFLPMCSLLGVAATSVFVGKISDKIGRKKVLIALAVISAVGGVVKYLCRATFWPYCAAEFFFGFFLGNAPVAMAYIGDVATSKEDKEAKLGALIGSYVIGCSGGGIIAILLNDVGLFTPQLVSAGLIGFSAILVAIYVVEPEKHHDVDEVSEDLAEEGNGAKMVRPKELDFRVMIHIIAGSVADNFGSTALFPLCLSPLAFKHYFLDFIQATPAEDPVMALKGFQWLSVMVAFVVIPSAVATPAVFRALGVAGTCVFGNFMTGVLTLALLLIGNALGYVQGMNNMAMNFGQALAPWLFGLLADAVGTNATIIVGIGVSLLAAAINFPLTFDSRFGREQPTAALSKTIRADEESEFMEMELAGEVDNNESQQQ